MSILLIQLIAVLGAYLTSSIETIRIFRALIVINATDGASAILCVFCKTPQRSFISMASFGIGYGRHSIIIALHLF
jgi:Na+-transporting NADH:ubiquinone oxidoreductase subunit NqrD